MVAQSVPQTIKKLGSHLANSRIKRGFYDRLNS